MSCSESYFQVMGTTISAPARMPHHAQDAVDAEPGVPEASVGVVHFAFGPEGPRRRRGTQVECSCGSPLSLVLTSEHHKEIAGR